MRIAAVVVLASTVALGGCAVIFRGTKETVHLESNPAGADAERNGVSVGATPVNVDVPRNGSTSFKIAKTGYEDQHVQVRKSVNAAWAVVDIATCVIPIALCIPLLVDAISGGWMDVDDSYVAKLKPGTSSASAATSGSAVASAAPPNATAAVSGPPPEMSESERKATARAAFLEGARLQESGKCQEALGRLETAQRFYQAPTHLLHIAQCQAATGKLVEAAETYETLSRTNLPKDAPEAFRAAQDSAKKEVAAIRPRIPTLRISVTPDPSKLSSLVVKMNGNAMPNEVLGLARPVNPGTYKITVWAAGYKEATADVEVGEGTPKAADLKLQK
jgi:hypothetical protein